MYNGTVATNSDTYGATRIRVVQNSINTTNNTSNVTIYYEAQVKNMTSFPNNLIEDLRVGHQANYNGTDYWNISNIRMVTPATSITKNNTWYTLYTWTGNVSHNAAGVCELAVILYFTAMDSQYHETGQSCYGSATLENTYKATTPTATFITQAKALNMGSAGTITLPRSASALTHKLVFKFGSTTQTLSTNAGASYSWTPAIATYAPQIPKATTGSGTLTCTTYNGSTQVGSPTTITLWLAVPSSVVPTATVATSDTTGYLTKYGGYVKGKSKLQVKVAGTGIQGSTISSYQATYDGTSLTGATTTFTPNVAGSRTVTGQVTDTRGRVGTKTATITVLDYANPTISNLQADRCDSEGNADTSGAYIKVVVNGSVSSLNSKNTKTERFRYKTSTSSTWSSWQTSGTIFAANVDYAYDIQAQVVDDFATTSQTTQVPGTFVLVDYGGMTGVEGTGLAFGGAATKANTFLNYLDLEAHGEVKVIDSNRGYADIVLGTNNYKNSFIRAYDNGTTYGHEMLIQSGAGMIIGAGEYPTNRYGLGDIKDQERLYLGSDNQVFIETNANTIANRKTFTFTNAGDFLLPVDGRLFRYSSTVINDATPSTTQDAIGFYVRDENDVNLARFGARQTSTWQGAIIDGARTINGTAYWNSLMLGVNSSGGAVVNIGGTGAAASWRKALGLSYAAGDTWTQSANSQLPCAGMITSGNTAVYFYIPLEKPVDATSCTVSGNVAVRSSQGYLYPDTAHTSTYYFAISNTSVVTHVRPGGVIVVMTMSGGWVTNSSGTAATGNRDLNVALLSNFKITFA